MEWVVHVEPPTATSTLCLKPKDWPNWTGNAYQDAFEKLSIWESKTTGPASESILVGLTYPHLLLCIKLKLQTPKSAGVKTPDCCLYEDPNSGPNLVPDSVGHTDLSHCPCEALQLQKQYLTLQADWMLGTVHSTKRMHELSRVWADWAGVTETLTEGPDICGIPGVGSDTLSGRREWAQVWGSRHFLQSHGVASPCFYTPFPSLCMNTM